ncbi:MAG: phosphatase PAP2 family protein [Clostridia bacterium]|nr:phosphatase PAP2 family protein [Clostridia bacterium]
MIKNEKRTLFAGLFFIAAFAVLTALILTVDVHPWGQNGTDIGFASFNRRFHGLTGVNMMLYTITDWLGLVPIAVCIIFGATGLCQLIKRRSLFKVDRDLIVLGVYYAVIIFAYLLFEAVPVNFRPVFIDGVLEASYPSSTVLLVLSVMPTLSEQTDRRLSNTARKKAIRLFVVLFCAFMVTGRLISGVHWFTDIAGSVILSAGLFLLYKSCVLRFCQDEK